MVGFNPTISGQWDKVGRVRPDHDGANYPAKRSRQLSPVTVSPAGRYSQPTQPV